MIDKKIEGNVELTNYYLELKNSGTNFRSIYDLLNKKEPELQARSYQDWNNSQNHVKNKIDASFNGYPMQDTYGFSPQTKGASWNEILNDDFSDNDISNWARFTSGNGVISQNSGSMKIDSHNGGKAYVESYPFNIYTENTQPNMFYQISLRFKLEDSSYNKWVYLILDDHIEVVIDLSGSAATVGYWEPFSARYISMLTLTQGTWYRVKVIYNCDSGYYGIWLYDSSDSFLTSISDVYRVHTNSLGFLLIGDTESLNTNYAYLSVDDVQIFGVSNSKFYQNFDHGLYYQWRVQTDSNPEIVRVDSNKDLKINTAGLGLANSAYIDYLGTTSTCCINPLLSRHSCPSPPS